MAPLLQLARQAEFFSGADLSAVLSEAQLAAVHDTLDAQRSAGGGEGAGPKGAPPTISRRHLEAALASARPSVPESERERLEGVYAKFQQSREGGLGAAVDKGKAKKVSWA